MTTLRITDYSGTSFTITTNESSDVFNARIDEAFNTKNYSISLVRFTRMDVRNIAMITEVKTDTPTQPETPVEEPTVPEEEPAPEEPTEPTEPEPSEDN